MTMSLTGARAVPAKSCPWWQNWEKAAQPQFQVCWANSVSSLCSRAEPPVLPTLNPVLPLLYLWSLVRPFLFPAYRIAAVSSWLAANCRSWVCPWVFSKQKEKAENSQFLQSQLSQRAHICPVERHRNLWAGWEHECSQGAPVSGGHRACLHQPDGNRQGQR